MRESPSALAAGVPLRAPVRETVSRRPEVLVAPANGKSARGRPAQEKPKGKLARSSYGRQVRIWAGSYIALTVSLSMGLNAYANARHAPPAMWWAAWGMGAVIPVLVLMLGRVGGLLYKQGALRTALSVGGIGVGVLALSVFHCCEAISILTGSYPILATLLAIGIDCGFVACEIAILVGGD